MAIEPPCQLNVPPRRSSSDIDLQSVEHQLHIITIARSGPGDLTSGEVGELSNLLVAYERRNVNSNFTN